MVSRPVFFCNALRYLRRMLSCPTFLMGLSHWLFALASALVHRTSDVDESTHVSSATYGAEHKIDSFAVQQLAKFSLIVARLILHTAAPDLRVQSGDYQTPAAMANPCCQPTHA
jgi:hypothetical protein